MRSLAPNTQTYGLRVAIVTKTGNYTATNSDDVILMDSTSGALNLTLLTAVGNDGLMITVKRIGANTVNMLTTSSQTIDGSTSASLNVINTALTVISDGANWRII